MLTHPISINAFEYFKLFGCERKEKKKDINACEHYGISQGVPFSSWNFDIFKTNVAFANVLHVCAFMQYPKRTITSVSRQGGLQAAQMKTHDFACSFVFC